MADLQELGTGPCGNQADLQPHPRAGRRCWSGHQRSRGDWIVEQHDDYDGYLTLMITSPDESRPTFLISGKADRIDLAELAGDDMRTLGTFSTVEAVIARLGEAIQTP